jgi:hypothetical protein
MALASLYYTVSYFTQRLLVNWLPIMGCIFYFYHLLFLKIAWCLKFVRDPRINPTQNSPVSVTYFVILNPASFLRDFKVSFLHRFDSSLEFSFGKMQRVLGSSNLKTNNSKINHLQM